MYIRGKLTQTVVFSTNYRYHHEFKMPCYKIVEKDGQMYFKPFFSVYKVLISGLNIPINYALFILHTLVSKLSVFNCLIPFE